MGNQFKVGDLAVIIGAVNVVSNIGLACELVEFLSPLEISAWRDPSDGKRLCNATGKAGWLVLGDGLRSSSGSDGWALVQTRHLMPLRGDLEPEQQKQREAEPCA